MVKVVRTEKDGSERVMLLETAVWATLVEKPHLVSGVKWRLWVAPKVATTKIIEVPIDAEVKITPKTKKDADDKFVEAYLKDEPEITQDNQYGEKDYKSDLLLGKKSVAEGDKETAKVAFKRALEFKPKNPYIKGQLKKL